MGGWTKPFFCVFQNVESVSIKYIFSSASFYYTTTFRRDRLMFFRGWRDSCPQTPCNLSTRQPQKLICRCDVATIYWYWKLHMQPFCLISCCQKSSPVLCYCQRYFLETVPQTFNCTCWSLLPMEMLLSANHSQVRQGQHETMNGFKTNRVHSQSSQRSFLKHTALPVAHFLAQYLLLWGQQGEITVQFQHVALHKALTWTKRLSAGSCCRAVCQALCAAEHMTQRRHHLSSI